MTSTGVYFDTINDTLSTSSPQRGTRLIKPHIGSSWTSLPSGVYLNGERINNSCHMERLVKHRSQKRHAYNMAKIKYSYSLLIDICEKDHGFCKWTREKDSVRLCICIVQKLWRLRSFHVAILYTSVDE